MSGENIHDVLIDPPKMAFSVPFCFRVTPEEKEEFRQLAAQFTLKEGRRVTESDVLRRMVKYGSEVVRRELSGNVIQGFIQMTDQERLEAIALRALRAGLLTLESAGHVNA